MKSSLFLSIIVALGLTAAALWQAFTPPTPEQVKIREVTQRIIAVRAADVPAMLRSKEGRPTILVIYASWCPYCRELMNPLMELVDNGTFARFDVQFLSEDNSFSELAAYLVKQGYETRFVPYFAKKSGVNDLKDVMKTTGSNFRRTIPYVGFFDKNGKMVAEFTGVVDKERLLTTASQF